MDYNIFIFRSTHEVMHAEKILRDQHLQFDIIPTPREFSSDCGISIRCTATSSVVQSIQKALKENGFIFKCVTKTMI